MVGIMDAGFSGTHEDIAPNLWINTQEIPGDGLDNDNNGFVDDYDGYNPRLENGVVPVHHQSLLLDFATCMPGGNDSMKHRGPKALSHCT